MSVVLSGQCQHLTYTTNIGPTTDQQNHTCAACGHFWTTFPAREEWNTRQAQAQGSEAGHAQAGEGSNG